MIYVTIGLFAFAFLYAGVPWLYGRLIRLSLKRKAEKNNAIVLTFDDGPGNRLTPKIMDLLAENNAKATFFLLGRNIVGREAIVRQIAERGHEICSHGYDHVHNWKVSPFRAISDIRRGWRAIDEALAIDKRKYPFRPPNGKLNIVCLLYLLFRQVPIVYWSKDSGDTWPVKPESDMLARVAGKAGGAVSLAHDFDRSNERTDQFVLDSTRAVLQMAQDKNMRLLTVSQLLSKCNKGD